MTHGWKAGRLYAQRRFYGTKGARTHGRSRTAGRDLQEGSTGVLVDVEKKEIAVACDKKGTQLQGMQQRRFGDSGPGYGQG